MNGLGQLERQEESVKQAAVADRIVLTKTDIAEASAIEALRRRLDRINPSAEFLVGNHGAVDPERVLRADVYDPAAKGGEVLRLDRGGGGDDPARNTPMATATTSTATTPASMHFACPMTSRSIGPPSASGSPCCCTPTARTSCGSRGC